MIATNQFHVES